MVHSLVLLPNSVQLRKHESHQWLLLFCVRRYLMLYLFVFQEDSAGSWRISQVMESMAKLERSSVGGGYGRRAHQHIKVSVLRLLYMDGSLLFSWHIRYLIRGSLLFWVIIFDFSLKKVAYDSHYFSVPIYHTGIYENIIYAYADVSSILIWGCTYPRWIIDDLLVLCLRLPALTSFSIF